MEISDHLQDILKSVPDQPGCYLMKNQEGVVIYVGKAINLRHRVRSYFHASAQKNPRTSQLVRNIHDIEWIIVGSELEALILEMNLIKEYQPHFNVQLKDDKRYPYIKIHWEDDYPKVTVTRKVEKDGSRYYGPYINVWAVNQTLDVLRKIFPYLTCSRTITGDDHRACLYHDIQLCTAPCIGRISQKNYREMIKELGAFLNGRSDRIQARLEEEMVQASEDMKYEQAAQIRDQLDAIQRIVQEQRIISTKFTDSDVIAMASLDNNACIQVFFIRGGKLTGREYFLVEKTDQKADQDLLSEVIMQFYDQAPGVPPEILLPREIEEARIIGKWLRSQRGGKKVELLVPRRGEKKKLVTMAAENAASMLTALKTREKSERDRAEGALTDHIRSVQGPDDYASMDEVLRRRFQRLLLTKEETRKPGGKPDPSFSAVPDLVLIDGGKGQLNRAAEVLKEFDLLDTIPIAGLAKRYEEVFLPGDPYPVQFEKNSSGLQLLQRSRDEAHRFAITAHRKRRSKKGLQSSLEKIPGIGPTRRQELLKKFKTIQNIREASVEELSQTPKITLKIAQSIKEHLA
jgi:excinuclease ABC subunit C